MNVSLSHRELFEKVSVIVTHLPKDERSRLIGLLADDIPGTKAERDLLGALEKVGGAQLLRIALHAKDGYYPADAILDHIECV